MTVEMIPVESSNIRGIGYDADNEVLYVTFNSGSQYYYAGVSREVHASMMDSPSKGKFFHARIKGAFPFEKVIGENKQ